MCIRSSFGWYTRDFRPEAGQITEWFTKQKQLYIFSLDVPELYHQVAILNFIQSRKGKTKNRAWYKSSAERLPWIDIFQNQPVKITSITCESGGGGGGGGNLHVKWVEMYVL